MNNPFRAKCPTGSAAVGLHSDLHLQSFVDLHGTLGDTTKKPKGTEQGEGQGGEGRGREGRGGEGGHKGKGD
eukprot:SAG11_NODE_1126_length_5765_cov_9.701553_4_plen_72_part_00